MVNNKNIDYESNIAEQNLNFLLKGNKQILYCILITTYVVIFVLAIKNLMSGLFVLGISLLFFVLLASIDTYAVFRNNKRPIHINIVVFCLFTALFLTIYYLGASTIYWMFPVSMVLIYLMPRNTALLVNTIALIVVSFYAFYHMEFAYAARASFSLTLTILFAFLIARHIAQLHMDLLNESIRDPLTEAFNRRQLNAHVENSLAQYKRSGLHSMLLMFDIDHFKVVNDTHGHDMGDHVIKTLAQLIEHNSREVDLLFRIGGEEFILLMHDVSFEQAKQHAEKIRSMVEQETIIPEHPITVSIGMSKPAKNYSSNCWLRHTDVALYQAKNNGRNQVCYIE